MKSRIQSWNLSDSDHLLSKRSKPLWDSNFSWIHDTLFAFIWRIHWTVKLLRIDPHLSLFVRFFPHPLKISKPQMMLVEFRPQLLPLSYTLSVLVGTTITLSFRNSSSHSSQPGPKFEITFIPCILFPKIVDARSLPHADRRSSAHLSLRFCWASLLCASQPATFVDETAITRAWNSVAPPSPPSWSTVAFSFDHGRSSQKGKRRRRRLP